MAAASLSTIELNYFNNAIFSAINRIRHILKQRADINRVLNEIKKNQEFKDITREYLRNHLNKLITEKKIINKINRDQDSYRVNRDILKIHEFDRAPSPVSPSNSSFNNSLSSILLPLTIETPPPAVTFNLTERPTANGALIKDTAQNILQPPTASPIKETIDNMLEMIEYSSIRGHIVSEIRKEIERIIAQKLKPLLENSESLIKSAKETYAHQLKVLKEELHCKKKIINTLLGIIEKFGNDKRDTQPVPLINFENDLTSPNKSDSEIDPKSDEQQQSHDNKQQISSKELSDNSKERDGTNSILVTDSVTVPNEDNKQQSHDDKQKGQSRKLCEYSKGESSIAQQIRQ